MNSSVDPDQLASSITVLRSVVDLSLSGRVLDLRFGVAEEDPSRHD